MPCGGTLGYDGRSYQRRMKIRALAIKQVKAKFPDLPEDSPGFSRAFENRLSRLYKSNIQL